MVEVSNKEDRLTLTVEEMCKLLGISRPIGFELVRAREIPAFRVGKRYLILRKDFDEWLCSSAGKDFLADNNTKK